jgi:hypothetical protein
MFRSLNSSPMATYSTILGSKRVRYIHQSQVAILPMTRRNFRLRRTSRQRPATTWNML